MSNRTFQAKWALAWHQRVHISCSSWKCHKTRLRCPPASTARFAVTHRGSHEELGHLSCPRIRQDIQHLSLMLTRRWG